MKVAFLGTGKMAGAIAGGLVQTGTFRGEELIGYDVLPESLAEFGKHNGAGMAGSAAEAVDAAQIVVIAVKPQHLSAALSPVCGAFDGKMVISIAAGVPIARIAQLTGARRIVRVMPNTPALVGEGCGAFAVSEEVTSEDLSVVERILGAIGRFYRTGESLLDAVTALSGSGPAYVFDFISALADGGVTEGLSRNVALNLAAQTVLGSAKLVLESGKHPGELRDMVSSPAGTTIAGLNELENRAFRAAVISAVRAAASRSRELGKS
ncbi:MAG: pyrroline-5-carboxylate reductase [Victivallaceae bacterium]|nr:pyrroline-5-carboxylate reductase [Victivallaceae bacterium]